MFSVKSVTLAGGPEMQTGPRCDWIDVHNVIMDWCSVLKVWHLQVAQRCRLVHSVTTDWWPQCDYGLMFSVRSATLAGGPKMQTEPQCDWIDVHNVIMDWCSVLKVWHLQVAQRCRLVHSVIMDWCPQCDYGLMFSVRSATFAGGPKMQTEPQCDYGLMSTVWLWIDV